MIDIGVNLTNSRFDKDRAQMLERAKEAGVTSLLVTGTSVEESHKASSLCQEYPDYLYSTAGVHPHDADHVSDDFLAQIIQLTEKPWVKAIGECGLDFNRNFSSPQQQQLVFARQIALAAELNMPLFLHQRDAFETWYNLLEPYLNKVPAMVAHCFTGTADELKKCLDANMYIGITGWLCDERRGQGLREIVTQIPLNRLMLETDAPYLIPRTIRPRPKSSRNEPAYLPYVVKALAEYMQVSEQLVVEHTNKNAQVVFGLN